MLRYKETIKRANILNVAEHRIVFCDHFLIIIINFFHNKKILQLPKTNKIVQHTGFNLTCISLVQVLKEIYIFMPNPVMDVVDMVLGHTSFASISDATFCHNISMLNLERSE